MKRKGFFIRQEWLDCIMDWLTKDGEMVPDANEHMVMVLGLLVKIAAHLDGEAIMPIDKEDAMDIIYKIIEPIVDEDLAELRKLGFVEQEDTSMYNLIQKQAKACQPRG